jgi:hypothetical protein
VAREAKVVLTTLDKTKAGIDSAIRNFVSMDDAVKTVGKTIAGAFTTAAVIGFAKQVADFGVASYKAFADAERAAVSFNTALAARTDISRTSLERFNETFSKSFGVDGEAILGMETMLIASGRTQDQIENLMTAAQALSVATGKDLKTAVDELNKSYSGTEGRLGTLIPELKDLSDEQLRAGEGVDVILEKFGHLNETVADLSDTKIKNLSNAWGDFSETIGEALKPQLDWAVTALTATIDSMAAAIRKATGGETSEDKIADWERQLALQQTLLDEARRLRDPLMAGGLTRAEIIQYDEYNKIADEALSKIKILQSLIADAKAGPAGDVRGDMTTGAAVIPDPPRVERAAGEIVTALAPVAAAVEGISEQTGQIAEKAEQGGQGFRTMAVAAQGSANDIYNAFAGFGEIIDNGITTAVTASLSAFTMLGQAIYEQQYAWEDLGAAAVDVLAQVLRGLGAQLAALAAVKLLTFDWVGAAVAAAAAAAAFAAAGFASAWATDLSGGTASSGGSGGGGGSGGYSGAGASYTGAQAITFNFFNQGNVVGSGGMEELAAIINGIIKRDQRYT